ncbi:MAG: alpha/beta hydrolase [Polyangiaceae bacterium]
MLPIFFGPPVRPLFGALHVPSSSAGAVRGAGVVLCSPFGHEAAHANRAERHLAERLAAAGFAVLRFDYDATGDSAGDDREPGRVAAWQDSVVAAVKALRERASVDKVALVGMRAGALLAFTSAADFKGEDGAPLADRLVLWNPVTSGRAHLRELTRLHKVLFPKAKGDKTEKAEKPDVDEALGFVVRKDTLADFGKLDMLAAETRPAAACLVIGGGDSPAEDKLLEKLRALDCEVAYEHLPGHPFLVTDPHKNDVPGPMIESIAKYLVAAYPSIEGKSSVTDDLRPGATRIAAGPAGEEAWQFGAPHTRFGVLTRPKDGSVGKPAIILMNAGSIHRVGPNRSFVRMARRWADLGYAVLRMDLSGIGDSPVQAGATENVPYPPDAVPDVQAAMTALAKEGVAQKFILTGLCSGADIAFRAGVLDHRVAAAWMINPQAFYFPSSDSLKEFMHAELQATYYESAFWDPERWKRVFRGEVDMRRVAGIMRAKVESAAKRRIARLLGQKPVQEDKPEARDVIGDLRSMANRGVDTFLLCSEDDPGLVYLLKYFGPELNTLDGVANYRRELVKGTDHTFTPLWSQDVLSDMLTEHLKKRHP